MRHVKWKFVALFTLLVSFVDKDSIFSGQDVGDKAPQFTLSATDEGEQPLSLKNLRGNYVLLSFWASYDAASRMQNVQLSKAVAHMPSQVRMVSVSFDEYRSVFDETVKKDRIDPAISFVELEGENSSLYKQYSLQKGFKNYLLNPEGVIIAKDVDADELSAYVQ
ncbi:MAG: redoxin domain-containing protein [Bacteroidaceae bacterium]|nr:redoxin domain-containing protein [Bacteroidaceae bacterium]